MWSLIYCETYFTAAQLSRKVMEKLYIVYNPMSQFTKVKARRPWLVLGWVTTREDQALWTWVRPSVCTWIWDRPSIKQLSCWLGRKMIQTNPQVMTTELCKGQYARGIYSCDGDDHFAMGSMKHSAFFAFVLIFFIPSFFYSWFLYRLNSSADFLIWWHFIWGRIHD